MARSRLVEREGCGPATDLVDTGSAPVGRAALDIAAARRVLRLEAEGIGALEASLDGRFGEAIELMAGASGRVIVTGMGKSGYVARKIAATFASTGTPAQFVHPAEASHGDLGMITLGDVVLALSNSGETAELDDVVSYSRRFKIPLIAVTRRAESTLAGAADIALVLPDSPEACPLGLAPTTSTTVMLALGDALAVALLERTGFTSTDYKALHPGGALGRRLLLVKDLMHGGEAVPLVTPDRSMADTILVMSEKNFGVVGVVDDGGQLIGVVTDGDLRRHMADDLLRRPAGTVMSHAPRTIAPTRLAAEALRVMNERPTTTLFVVDEGFRPVGIIRMHDCLKAGIA
jgi:arabinose-5-phosphate isomerase